MAERIEEAKQAGFTIEEIAASLLKESDRLQARVEALSAAVKDLLTISYDHDAWAKQVREAARKALDERGKG